MIWYKESGEEPVSAAACEFAEETGIRANTGRYVATAPISVSSTLMPELSYIFRVEVSEQEFAARQPHDNEIHRVERIVIEESGMTARDEIYVSVPLAILGIFLTSHGRNRFSST